MPFVVTDNDQQTTRKRRWDDDADNHSSIYRLYDEKQDYYLLNAAQDYPPPRRVLPLSSKTKRARLTSDDDNISLSRDTFSPTHRHRPSQQKLLQEQPIKSTFRPTAAILAPCYICHRRPTKKSDLDSFAACQGCGERACFVCVRQCQGWNVDDGMSVISEQEMLSRSFHIDDADAMNGDSEERANNNQEATRHNEQDIFGRDADVSRRFEQGWAASGHRSVVCSRCCVESGREGEVVCLGCLSSMPGA